MTVTQTVVASMVRLLAAAASVTPHTSLTNNTHSHTHTQHQQDNQHDIKRKISDMPFACGMCFPYPCSCKNNVGIGTCDHDGHISCGRFDASLNSRRRALPLRGTLHAHLTQTSNHIDTSKKESTTLRYASNLEVEKQRRRSSAAANEDSPPSTAVPAAAALSTLASRLPSKGNKASLDYLPPPPSVLTTCPRCHSGVPSSRTTTIESNATNACRFCKVYTGAELDAHSTKDALWICIDGRIYDVSRWARFHPGGMLPLLDTAGSDASDVFKVFHDPKLVAPKMASMQIGIRGEFDENGRFKDDSMWQESALQQDFHGMVRQLELDGQFQTDYRWYTLKAIAVSSILLLSLAFLAWYLHSGCTSWWSMVASALLLGLFWQQLAFLGHDLGHNSVGGSIEKDWLPGLIVTAFFGVSVQWWKRNHNVHHVVTNSMENDPDIQHLPIMAVTEKAFKGFYSTYFECMFQFDRLSQILVSHQHNLYYLTMALARFNLYVQSILLVSDRSKAVRCRKWEIGALVFYWVWLVALLMLLPSSSVRIAFLLISHSMAGLVHVQITLSHFCMPVHTGRGYSSGLDPSSKEFFLRSQFATTLDISCPAWLDWVHGGLQFQTTHHLLPRIPRHRLRAVREKYVKPLAAKYGIVYHEESFTKANQMVLETLREAALKSRAAADASLKNSLLWRFMQADG